MIGLESVALDVGGRRLLDGIDGSIASGEFVAIVGPNGAGKTTLLRAIAGLHPPAAGRITVNGRDVSTMAPLRRALAIAMVTSDDVLFEALRVRDVAAIGRFPHHRWWQWRERPEDDDAVSSALHSLGLDAFAERFVWTLSTGERQRVWIAAGLAQATPVLLLDEPTSHLDLRVAHEILSLLRAQTRTGKTVACVMHDVNDAAAYADRIALLGDGRLAAFDVPDRVLASDVLEQTYGVAMQRLTLPDGTTRVFAAVDR
ncbi:MAG: ABC transporter ATP-binding protein [Candidatus Eremiobacteraeota bacterium]|nr:ABC transporter ATP-binding protein [Candidatus Eremiobacteraeota bacterium]